MLFVQIYTNLCTSSKVSNFSFHLPLIAWYLHNEYQWQRVHMMTGANDDRFHIFETCWFIRIYEFSKCNRYKHDLFTIRTLYIAFRLLMNIHFKLQLVKYKNTLIRTMLRRASSFYYQNYIDVVLAVSLYIPSGAYANTFNFLLYKYRAQGPESRTENFYALTKTGLHKLNLENFFLIVLLVSLISSASMYVSETFQILQFWL